MTTPTTPTEAIAAVLAAHEGVAVDFGEWYACSCGDQAPQAIAPEQWDDWHRAHVAAHLAALQADGGGLSEGDEPELTIPAIETIETVLGIRNSLGILEPIIEGRKYDTRVTPILTLRRTVLWAESEPSRWEVVEPALLAAPTETAVGSEGSGQ